MIRAQIQVEDRPKNPRESRTISGNSMRSQLADRKEIEKEVRNYWNSGREWIDAPLTTPSQEDCPLALVGGK